MGRAVKDKQTIFYFQPSLNQRLVFPKGPNNQNTVKKMIPNVQYI